MQEAPSYGQIRRRRSEVTYSEIERAATDILKSGVRPTVEGVRKTLAGGSPRTVADGLNRYWRDLGNQLSGNPDSLRRLPAAVADLAEGLWEKALERAADTASANNSVNGATLGRLKTQLEQREHTLSQREIELDELVRTRERTIKELEDHLRAALSMLAKRDTSLQAMEKRVVASQTETEDYRARLALLIQRSVVRRDRTPTKRAPEPRRRVQPVARTKTIKTRNTVSRRRR